MKSSKVFSIILSILAISFSSDLSVAQSVSETLLGNGGFEERGERGLARGWNVVPHHAGRGEAMMDDKIVHSGRYSLRLTPSRKNTSEGFGVFKMLEATSIQGREITIKGYARVEGVGDSSAAILLKTDKKDWVTIPKGIENRFFPFSQTFSVSKSIPEAGFLILVGGTKGNFWFDDLSIEVSETSSGKKAEAPSPPLEASTDISIHRINTLGWQDSVFISPDGQELYFAYLPYTQKDFMDIYFKKIREKDVKVKGPIRPNSHGTMNFETYKVIKNKDGTWGRPINLNINSTYSLYSAKVSFDGQELFYAIRDYEKNYGGDDIYVSNKLSDGSWGSPENLGPNINTKYREDTPCVSRDGKTLYFARNQGETLGWEIMVSYRVDGKWSKAEKLGPPINEPNPEKTANHQPFITADGQEFYFTRITHLYKSQWQPNGSWSKPVRVFRQLKVSGHASVTAGGRYLYFLTATDEESLKRHHWTIWYAERQKDRSWGKPNPVD